METRSNRWLASIVTLAVPLLAACSSSTGGGPPSIDGNWIYANASTNLGEGVTFNSDGTYAFSIIRLTSQNSADVQLETGTFAVSGSAITATPRKWSCPGPDPIAQLNYSFQGSNLELVEPTGAVVFQPNTAMAMGALTIGCFDSSGNFKAEPLAVVSN